MSRGEAAGHSGVQQPPPPKDKPKRSACPAAKPRGTAEPGGTPPPRQTKTQRMSRGEAAGHSGTRRNPAPKDKPKRNACPAAKPRGTAEPGGTPPQGKPKRSACPAAKPRGTAGHSKPPAPPQKTKPQPSAAVAVLKRRNKRSGTKVPRLCRGTQWSAVCSDVVRAWGLEPQRIAAREPKSRMSANSIMPAYSAGLAFSRGGAAAPAWIIILPTGGGVNLGVDFGGAVD